MDKIHTVHGISLWEQMIEAGKGARASGSLGEAVTFFQSAAKIAARYDVRDPRRSASLRYLGSLNLEMGRHEAAAAAFAEALEIVEATLAMDGHDLKSLGSEYAEVCRQLGDETAAAAVRARVLAVARRQAEDEIEVQEEV